MLLQLRKLKNVTISLDKKNKVRQLPSFLNRVSTLLNEGYTFSDSIEMLLPYHVDDPNAWRVMILEKLKNGEGTTEILECFQIPKHFLVAIKISEESGKLAESLQTISKQLDFNEKMRKKLLNLLSYPVLLSVLLISIFIAFRTYFLPNITQILNTRSDGGNTTVLISSIFLRLPDVLFFTLITTICLVTTVIIYIKRLNVQQQLPLLLKLPIINYFYKMHITNHLAKTMGDLLLGGFSLQQALTILQDQQLNKILAYVSKEIEGQVIFGESLSSAVYKLGWFSSKFEEFIKHGENSGYLGRQLLIYSELIDEKIQNLIKKGVSIIQPLFFIIIALSIIAAYLSILLPMYELIEII
ncbi:competence type IV pilus assembly protein ComGB [Ureibacillus chungkukjangi]|uniref:Competence protein ComGB n=1 Tax=Ureibacillus chungkukjangi TaxID=1202712 RepID=A0A318TEU9_9BACL|nr:competence type IV pilus assembly protein ComGB [Ureibacillus chungkukjangi]MCM3389934.1 type II secretion system F family protein [Ureibacillus chungkukjangi]PYF03492.1 competence protein ComGB [Ureibacillus chungkukjangi]